MDFKYRNAILGGTFDRFHTGHKRLINKAFEQSEKVIIGVTTNKLIKNKLLSNVVENYKTRENYVKKYLENRKLLKRSMIIPIHDIYANSLREKNIQALFATKATFKNAVLVNSKREEIGFPPLKIVTISLVEGNDGKIITSERIRLGEIDRSGRAYIKIFKNKKRLTLPEKLREELRKPVGYVVKNLSEIKKLVGNNKIPVIITVGDIVSMKFTEAFKHPDISIIDFKTRRKSLDRKRISRLLAVSGKSHVNLHGTISRSAVGIYYSALKKYLKTGKKQTIFIKGEEDLLAVPVILLAPLGSLVLYGQYGLGAVVVEITEQKKKQVWEILKKFD